MSCKEQQQKQQQQQQTVLDECKPTDFSKVVGNARAVRVLQNIVTKQAFIPNLLVCGPPGCGKTTCIDILCAKLVSLENHSSCILRTSSFDDRGIDHVRTRVRNFARGRVKVKVKEVKEVKEEEEEEDEEGRKIQAGALPCKLVVVDEADSMPIESFQALRNVMDANSDTTRFIIACNDSTRVIEPIQSRCAILRFSKIEEEPLCSRIRGLCQVAGVEYTEEGIQAIAYVADGDMRKAFSSLRATFSAFKTVTADNVYKTSDTPRPAALAAIIDLLRIKGRYAEAARMLERLCDEGYSVCDIVSGFFQVCRKMEVGGESDVEEAVEVAKVIGLTHVRVVRGQATFVQLAAMLWRCHQVYTR